MNIHLCIFSTKEDHRMPCSKYIVRIHWYVWVFLFLLLSVCVSVCLCGVAHTSYTYLCRTPYNSDTREHFSNSKIASIWNEHRINMANCGPMLSLGNMYMSRYREFNSLFRSYTKLKLEAKSQSQSSCNIK